jgi:hypothetical protein
MNVTAVPVSVVPGSPELSLSLSLPGVPLLLPVSPTELDAVGPADVGSSMSVVTAACVVEPPVSLLLAGGSPDVVSDDPVVCDPVVAGSVPEAESSFAAEHARPTPANKINASRMSLTLLASSRRVHFADPHAAVHRR